MRSRWILSALAALLALWLLPWRRGGDALGPESESTALAPEPVAILVQAPAALEAGVAQSAPAGSARAALTTGSELFEDASRSCVPDPYEYEFSGRVLDPQDLPVVGAEIFLGPARHALNRIGTTDERGEFKARWRARASRMELALSVGSDGAELACPLKRVELAAGCHAIALRVWPPRQAASDPPETDELQEEEGSPGTGTFALASTQAPNGLWISVAFAGGSESAGYARDERPDLCLDEEGWGTFLAAGERSCSGNRVRLSLETMLVINDREFLDFGKFLAARNVLQLVREAQARPEPPPRPSVRGRVLDREGQAVAGATLALGADPRALQAVGSSADDGSFLLEDLEPGSCWLRAGGGDQGRAWVELSLAEGQAATWEARLERGLELRGRLIDENDAALADWRIEADEGASADTWCDGTLTGADGGFAIPNCPSARVELHAFAPDGSSAATAGVFTGLRPGATPLELRLSPRQREGCALRLAAEHADQSPAAELEVRAWQLDSDLGEWLSGSSSAGEFRAPGLAAGTWLLELGAPRQGWRTLGPLHLRGGELDLGVIGLDPAGRLEVELMPGAPEDLSGWRFELYESRHDVRSRIFLGEGVAPPRMDLASGNYELVVSAPGREPRALDFAVIGQASTRVQVHLDSTKPARLRLAPADPEPVQAKAFEFTYGFNQACTSCHVGMPGGEREQTGADNLMPPIETILRARLAPPADEPRDG